MNCLAECGVGLAAARPEEALAESGDEFAITLSSAEHGGNNTSAPAAKNLDDPAHLLAQVRVNGAGIGEVEVATGAAGESICDKRGFVRPPAVDSCLADAGMRRHGFDAELGKPVLSQELQGATQDGCASLLAARPHGA